MAWKAVRKGVPAWKTLQCIVHWDVTCLFLTLCARCMHPQQSIAARVPPVFRMAVVPAFQKVDCIMHDAAMLVSKLKKPDHSGT